MPYQPYGTRFRDFTNPKREAKSLVSIYPLGTSVMSEKKFRAITIPFTSRGTTTYTLPILGIPFISLSIRGADGSDNSLQGGEGGILTVNRSATTGEVLTIVVGANDGGGRGDPLNGGVNGGGHSLVTGTGWQCVAGAGGGASNTYYGAGGGCVFNFPPDINIGNAKNGIDYGGYGAYWDPFFGAVPGTGGPNAFNGTLMSTFDSTNTGGDASIAFGSGGGGSGYAGGGGGGDNGFSNGAGGGGLSYVNPTGVVSASSTVGNTGAGLNRDGEVLLTFVVEDSTPSKKDFTSTQTYVVPNLVTHIEVEVYGTKGEDYGIGHGVAGKGGTVRGVIPVVNGETLLVVVGQTNTGTYPSKNGGAGPGSILGGSCSYIMRQSDSAILALAGGGGAGGYTIPGDSVLFNGGNGGSSIADAGGDGTLKNGGGGDQSTGGIGGIGAFGATPVIASNGGYLQGGDGNDGGALPAAGGGGGYYGGGGGAAKFPNPQRGSGAGGGGSSYTGLMTLVNEDSKGTSTVGFNGMVKFIGFTTI